MAPGVTFLEAMAVETQALDSAVAQQASSLEPRSESSSEGGSSRNSDPGDTFLEAIAVETQALDNGITAVAQQASSLAPRSYSSSEGGSSRSSDPGDTCAAKAEWPRLKPALQGVQWVVNPNHNVNRLLVDIAGERASRKPQSAALDQVAGTKIKVRDDNRFARLAAALQAPTWDEALAITSNQSARVSLIEKHDLTAAEQQVRLSRFLSTSWHCCVQW